MFSGHFVESKGKVVVTDISSYTMKKVLLYIYSGYIHDAEIDVDVLYAADKYEMEQLKTFSESKLKERLNNETYLISLWQRIIVAHKISKNWFLDFYVKIGRK